VIPCGMWVPVAVWQPCELLYTCYLLTYGGGVTNKIVNRIFGAMSKDLCGEICVHFFSIDSVENLVASRQNCFINRHGEADKYL